MEAPRRDGSVQSLLRAAESRLFPRSPSANLSRAPTELAAVQFPTIWRNVSSPADPRYLQKPSFQKAEASGALLPGADKDPGPGPSAPEVAIDSGVVVFSGEATLALARLAYSETFKGCTARGVAEGASALRLELYSDLLLALKTGAAAGVSWLWVLVL